MSKRHDFYGPIHKGLRFGASHLLARLGSIDWHDEPARQAMLAELRLYLGISQEHLEHEEAEINVILRRRAPALGQRLDDDHAENRAMIAALEAAIASIEAAPDGERDSNGRDLYLRFSHYVADDLGHMVREEDEALSLFHALFTDAELAAIEARIVQSIAPSRMIDYFRLMFPAASPPERKELLHLAFAGAPPEARAVLLNDVVRPSVSNAEWLALDREFAGTA